MLVQTKFYLNWFNFVTNLLKFIILKYRFKFYVANSFETQLITSSELRKVSGLPSGL
jgi:hypothetical protein